jgi:hypothetical protein
MDRGSDRVSVRRQETEELMHASRPQSRKGESPKLDERLTIINPGQFSVEIAGQFSAEIDTPRPFDPRFHEMSEVERHAQSSHFEFDWRYNPTNH